MELVKANVSILDQKPDIKGMYEQIEIPGRICYGSLDRVTDGSAEPFVHTLEKSNHGGPMEHGTIYLHVKISILSPDKTIELVNFYVNNKFSYVNCNGHDYYITTNYRVLFENDRLDDLKYFCNITEYHEPRITASFIIDRFTGEEYLRHRMASFNRESTRFIDLIRDKFGAGSIKFIIPTWADDDIQPLTEQEWRTMCMHFGADVDKDVFTAFDYWLFSLYTAEYCYANLRRLGWQPQQARTVLPCAIDSPLIMTASLTDWIHFFNLRVLGKTGTPHPQAKELAEPLMNMFIERALIELNNNEITRSR